MTSSIKIVRELTEEEIRDLLKGKVNYEVWRDEVTKDLHRDNDLPALIWYFKNGSKKYEEWFNNGKLHRENDLPALINYYKNGSIQIEEWWINGLRSRDRENDLPALIWYYNTVDNEIVDNNGVIGNVEEEEWFKNGKYHRENDLPAIIHYHENGIVKYEEWFTNGLRSRCRDNDLPAII